MANGINGSGLNGINKQVTSCEDLTNDDDAEEVIELLPAIDHSTMKYNVARTDFYTPHEDVSQLEESAVEELRQQLRLSAIGFDVVSPVPLLSLLEQSLGKEIMDVMREQGESQPTPIQAQAIPVALSGRDIIGIAETGSGKTTAYLVPMLVHCMAQPKLAKGEGPIAVVLCPTRELAARIDQECRKFSKRLGLNSIALTSSVPKQEQAQEVERGAEIAICNPGRLIDLVKMKSCALQRVTFLVLDEADSMFYLGLESQIRSIVQNVRPDGRQMLLFSASFPAKLEKFARDILQLPAQIIVGEVGEIDTHVKDQAASRVIQHVEVFKTDDEKWPWLAKRVNKMLLKGQMLIFVKSISSAVELAQNFQEFLEKKVEVLHGDLDQRSRLLALTTLQTRRAEILIATDAFARGLDLPSVATVISYEAARDFEMHSCRVGCTGRGAASGETFTLLAGDSEDEKRMAALLVDRLEQSGQLLAEELMELALSFAPFRAAKLQGKKFESQKRVIGRTVHSRQGMGFGADAAVAPIQRRQSDTDMPAAAPDFVAAAPTEELAPHEQKPRNDDSSSDDEDLFAPGVKLAFGKPPPRAPTLRQPGLQRRRPEDDQKWRREADEKRQADDQQRIMEDLFNQEQRHQQLLTQPPQSQHKPQYPPLNDHSSRSRASGRDDATARDTSAGCTNRHERRQGSKSRDRGKDRRDGGDRERNDRRSRDRDRERESERDRERRLERERDRERERRRSRSKKRRSPSKGRRSRSKKPRSRSRGKRSMSKDKRPKAKDQRRRKPSSSP